jgi:polar amino acid transport system permease protein
MKLDLSVLTGNAGAILGGFAITVETWIAGVAMGILIGLAIALVQRRGIGPVNRILRLYIEVIRGTPFLVQLFFLYYGGPSIGLQLEAVSAGILGLGIYGSAYFAEVFRAGFNAVPKGQLEAASCLGLSRRQTVWRIMLPQMLVIIVPSLTNTIIVLSKETAVLSVITVPELTGVLTGIGSASYAFTQVLLAMCAGYLLLVELTAWFGRWVEAKVGRYMLR